MRSFIVIDENHEIPEQIQPSEDTLTMPVGSVPVYVYVSL